MLIPVMDAGFERSFQKIVRNFSQPNQQMDVLRYTHSTKSVSIDYTERIAEPMYIDSKYSAFIQLTDCIAGLRKTIDTIAVSKKEIESAYKQELFNISKKLDKNIVYEELIELRYNGVPPGPSLLSR